MPNCFLQEHEADCIPDTDLDKTNIRDNSLISMLQVQLPVAMSKCLEKQTAMKRQVSKGSSCDQVSGFNL